MGNWERVEGGQVRVIFRKLLFDGLRNNFGDLRVTGMITASGTKLSADWQIDVVDLSGTILFPFGAATSEGIRIE